MVQNRQIEGTQFELAKIRSMADRYKTEILRAEASIEAAEARRKEIHAQLKSLGIDPDKAEEEVRHLEEAVVADMQELRNLIVDLARLVGKRKEGAD